MEGLVRVRGGPCGGWFGITWAGVENGNGLGLILGGKYVRVELGMGLDCVQDAKDTTSRGKVVLDVRWAWSGYVWWT